MLPATRRRYSSEGISPVDASDDSRNQRNKKNFMVFCMQWHRCKRTTYASIAPKELTLNFYISKEAVDALVMRPDTKEPKKKAIENQPRVKINGEDILRHTRTISRRLRFETVIAVIGLVLRCLL